MPTFNGVSYPESDFLDRGYLDQVTSGTGSSLPRWQAAFVDAIADAGKQMRGSSVTSNDIGSGTKTFVLDNDLPFGANEAIWIFSTVNRANNMFGTVTSYTQATKTLVVSITDTNGSGTGLTSWSINSAGPKGATGSTGATYDISASTTESTYANIVNIPVSIGAGSSNNRKMAIATFAAGLGFYGKQALWIPAGFIRASSTTGATAPSATATGAAHPDQYGLSFDPTTQQYAEFMIGMPKSWNEGTVTAKFVWQQASAATDNRLVWNLQGVACSDTDSVDVAFGTAQQVADGASTGGAAKTQYVTAETSAITIAGSPAAEDIVKFRVSRVTGDASDVMSVAALLEGIILYVTTDTGNDA